MFNLCQTLADKTLTDVTKQSWMVSFTGFIQAKNVLILIKMLKDKTLFDGLARSGLKMTKNAPANSWSKHDRRPE